MNQLVSLEKVMNNTAYITDLEADEQTYEVQITDEQQAIYQSLLDEAQAEELEDEETGVFVFFDNETNQLTLSESEL